MIHGALKDGNKQDLHKKEEVDIILNDIKNKKYIVIPAGDWFEYLFL